MSQQLYNRCLQQTLMEKFAAQETVVIRNSYHTYA